VTCKVDRWRRLASRMGQSVWPGKKIAGQRANRKGGSRRRIVAPSLGARPGLLTVRMQGTDFSVWSSFSGAAFSFLAVRPLVAELGRAARLGDRAPVNEVVRYRRSNNFADKFTHI
jgi:hypothetical protein